MVSKRLSITFRASALVTPPAEDDDKDDQ